MQEIWGGFSQDDVGKEIEVSGRAGIRWFYKPLSRAKQKAFSVLGWKVEFWTHRTYSKVVPLRVQELVEKVCYRPVPSSGIYLIKAVDGDRAMVERVK